LEGKSALGPSDYEYFIFDLDGTLFTIPVDWTSVRRELSSITGEQIEGTPLFLRVQQLVAGRPALREKLFSTIDSYELRVAGMARPLPGASELLYSLFEVAKIALVTMQGKRVCDEILRRHRVSDLFEVVVTREDSMDRAVQLDAALDRLGARPREALFIGDRANDVASARKVGVKIALVGKDLPGHPAPDYTFSSLREFNAYVR